MKRWSEEEVELLKTHYPNETKEFLKELFKRNWISIRTKAESIQLKRSKFKTGKIWTIEDEEMLKEMYENNDSADEIASSLERTKLSISTKASNLGLKRKKVVKNEVKININEVEKHIIEI